MLGWLFESTDRLTSTLAAACTRSSSNTIARYITSRRSGAVQNCRQLELSGRLEAGLELAHDLRDRPYRIDERGGLAVHEPRLVVGLGVERSEFACNGISLLGECVLSPFPAPGEGVGVHPRPNAFGEGEFHRDVVGASPHGAAAVTVDDDLLGARVERGRLL